MDRRVHPTGARRYRCTVIAWIDHFESWRRELERRTDPGDIRIALQMGAVLIDAAAARAGRDDAANLSNWAALLRTQADDATGHADAAAMQSLALDPARAVIARRYADRAHAASASLELVADRKRAQFSSWYELFPRLATTQSGRHGTFADVQTRLPYLARMGFDVLYMPPIHPHRPCQSQGREQCAGIERG